MQELKINVSHYGTEESLVDNIKHALTLGLPELTLSLIAHDGTFVVCGSGPTLKQHVEEIRAEYKKGRPICAVKGAYDFLVGHDIIPAIFVSVEPRVRPINNPHPDTVFLLASRCNPELFESLKDYQVVLWHSWSIGYENDAHNGHMAIGGGTTSGLRAINIGYTLGFHNFHLYGFDSCLIEGEKRLGQGPIDQQVTTTDVIVGGKRFVCNLAMAQQADDFQYIYEFLPGIHVESFGDGLITAILNERAKQGLPV